MSKKARPKNNDASCSGYEDGRKANKSNSLEIPPTMVDRIMGTYNDKGGSDWVYEKDYDAGRGSLDSLFGFTGGLSSVDSDLNIPKCEEHNSYGETFSFGEVSKRLNDKNWLEKTKNKDVMAFNLRVRIGELSNKIFKATEDGDTDSIAKFKAEKEGIKRILKMILS